MAFKKKDTPKESIEDNITEEAVKENNKTSKSIGFLSRLFKEENIIMTSAIEKSTKENIISTGSPLLDDAIGGGISLNKASLFFGPRSSCKSSICWFLAGKIQKLRKDSVVLIFDTEYYFDERTDRIERLHKFGVDIDNVFVISSSNMNEAFSKLSKIEDLLKENKIDISVIIVDSLAGLEDKKAANKIEKGEIIEAGESVGGSVKNLNVILTRLLQVSAKYKITTFLTNQVTANMDAFSYEKYTLPSGLKLQHMTDMIALVETVQNASSRLGKNEEILAPSDKESEQVGKLLRINIKKCRNRIEGAKCEVWIDLDKCSFVRIEESLFTLATKKEIIYHPLNEEGKPSNMMWSYKDDKGNEIKVRGQDEMISKLKDKDLYHYILEKCKK